MVKMSVFVTMIILCLTFERCDEEVFYVECLMYSYIPIITLSIACIVSA